MTNFSASPKGAASYKTNGLNSLKKPMSRKTKLSKIGQGDYSRQAEKLYQKQSMNLD